MKPVGNRAIARIIKEEKKTESGLILSEESAQKEQNLVKAEILSSNVADVNVGDIVYYSRFTGSPFGRDMIVLDARDILVKEV